MNEVQLKVLCNEIAGRVETYNYLSKNHGEHENGDKRVQIGTPADFVLIPECFTYSTKR